MRIVIDMQGAQSESRFRGIGRYTLSLTQAIVRSRGEHEIILSLSGLFPDTIESLRAAFDGLLPQENIRVWYAPGPVREGEDGNTCRREVAERIREAFLASLKPDVVLITSLFEGFVDDAVTSIGVFDSQMPTAMILYDLIPYLDQKTYLEPNPPYEQYYLRKIKYFKRADLYLAISKSSAKEGINALGLSKTSVVNISAACNSIFKPTEISLPEKKTLFDKFGIIKSFIMYAGGADDRKNLHKLIKAFAILSSSIRNNYQLVMVGKMPDGNVMSFKKTAKGAGLKDNKLVFTGYVPDLELVKLYNLCDLFVFPSWHEGFGLPALEAMSCGCAVIAANTTSLPEIIGREDMLFNPFDEQAIAGKIAQVLSDDTFRRVLKKHGIEQAKKFSWDESAKRAITALEMLNVRQNKQVIAMRRQGRCPRLAYVSPLPPEKSGISDYSSELLQELVRHYDIEVIVAQEVVSDVWINANCPVRSVEWFQTHAQSFDRVLYHFGNSPFHQHMLGLLEEFPGVIMLHDFFLPHIVAHMDAQGFAPHSWATELYHSHGYNAIRERFHAKDTANIIYQYPCNLSVLQNALGIIVHSEYPRHLAKTWYSESASNNWATIPFLRAAAQNISRADARRALNLKIDDFVVCSFGWTDLTKLNHRLLKAWLTSDLVQDKRCVLVFVGENHGGDYGQQLLKTIQQSGLDDRIRITGWVDMETYRTYLSAADVGVQLRTLSRGETSASVIDCMNYNLATIVNANGGIVELPKDAVWMLPDEFDDAELINALHTLWHSDALRQNLGAKAREVISSCHIPRICAIQYFEAIEQFYMSPCKNNTRLISEISQLKFNAMDSLELIEIAAAISQNHPPMPRMRTLFCDVSATSRNNLKTGIERVVYSLLIEIIENPPAGYRVEPIYLTDEEGIWQYRYARQWTSRFLDCPCPDLTDEPVEYYQGDLLLCVDLTGGYAVEANKAGLYNFLRNKGINLYFVVYDLLPILMPSFFPEGAAAAHEAWIKVVTQSDGAVCISKTVADELTQWVQKHGLPRQRPFKISWFHQGYDIENSMPTRGFPENREFVLGQLKTCPSFLMVGTIEPRKGYGQTLDAFEQLWAKDIDVNLVIVGKEGWKHLQDAYRRNIPEIVKRLNYHPELGKRLFWLEGISDEYLEKVYASSTCLIAASEGEGFGLPLIEAARHKLPIIARDIPVFREVADNYAYYFSDKKPNDLADALKQWLELYKNGKHPKSDDMACLTWKQSAERLMQIILNDDWTYYVMPDITDITIKYELDHHALVHHLHFIHNARIKMVMTLLPEARTIIDLGGANWPLYLIYPFNFDNMTIIDLSPDMRHEMYKNIKLDEKITEKGKVFVSYSNMTDLSYFLDNSIDLVWIGQGIEHITEKESFIVFNEVKRVLKPKGYFCLDTPNRLLTKIHTAWRGGDFINPDHKIEYTPEHLKHNLKISGFKIIEEKGICDMPNTIKSGEFDYKDFILGSPITDDVNSAYIQFYRCGIAV